MSVALELEDLGRDYRVHEHDPGVKAAIKSLFRRQWKTVNAVGELSFEVEEGEIVGFLGPNGAGKTTTIKMLAGLLYPTRGRCRVLGRDPWKREKELLRQITLIMGRRNQLIWDVPAIESFEFFRAVFDIPRAEYKETLGDLVELLDLEPILHKPVRNLSLGQRMRCELTGALLHRPRILFLDEPTIGLDLLAQYKFREYIAQYNKKYNASILLTSHYMGDIEDLCERVIFIDHGKLIFDGKLSDLVDRFLPYKTIKVRMSGANGNLQAYGEVIERNANFVTFKVPKEKTTEVVTSLVADFSVQDINVSDPPVTDVVRFVYSAADQVRDHKQEEVANV